MRLARTPQMSCGDLRASNRPRRAAAFGRALACLLAFDLALASAVVTSSDAAAQDPSRRTARGGPAPSFPKQQDGIFGAKPELDKSLPLYLQGDQLIYDTAGNRVIARGNVEIYYNNNILTADEVIYDQSANTLSAVGNVTLKEANGNIIRAERYTLTEDFRDGFVESLSVVARDESRISAARATRREGNITEFTDAKFTACPETPGIPPLWCIRANKVIHDQSEATITYQDAQFEIFGAPVLYLPYFQHADPSVKRKSGFLAPEYSSSNDLGFGLKVPYYFALAPNYDVLLHPLYTTEQGALWQLDWRHRVTRNGQYTIKVAGIDQNGDNLPGLDLARQQSLDGWRGSVETRGRIDLSSWWRVGWDVTLESDDTFRRFYKLDSILLTDRVNNVHLKGISDRNYFALNLYHFGGLLIADTPDSESLVHPIADYNYVFDDPILGGELTWNTSALSFSRDDQIAGRIDQNLQRISTEVKWRRRLTDQLGITYTPFGELRGDVYQFSNYDDPFNPAIFYDDENVTRGIAAGGVTVAYPWVANSSVGSHVIEPIGQIVTRNGSVEQARLPNEDARSLIFDDTNLFDTNKFSGWDRLETGTRTNVGVQYTFQANNGGYARVLAGQSFHLSGDNAYQDPGLVDPDPSVTDSKFLFSPTSGLETNKSDYVLGFYLAPLDGFHLLSQSRFDDENLALRREELLARFEYGPLSSRVGYSYTADEPEFTSATSQQEIIGSLGLRLTDRWGVYGALRYDLDESRVLTDSVQLRYGDECFALTATYTETRINDPLRDIEPDQTVMFRFELKHLGAYQYKTDLLDHTEGDQQPPTL